MPHSAAEPPGRELAVAAESLFLANLLVAPGLAFLAIVWLRHKHPAVPPLARCHLDQAFFVSLWGGGLLVVASSLVLALGGLAWKWTWVMVILYFTCIHSTLVLLGALGLAKALAGKPYVYPLIGPRCE
ncbi:MAG: hypothetical protein HZC24_05635 [Rhodocyclales bacterium]|nr:hypothetical protein [Rhodocyclales bacterium]